MRDSTGAVDRVGAAALLEHAAAALLPSLHKLNGAHVASCLSACAAARHAPSPEFLAGALSMLLGLGSGDSSRSSSSSSSGQLSSCSLRHLASLASAVVRMAPPVERAMALDAIAALAASRLEALASGTAVPMPGWEQGQQQQQQQRYVDSPPTNDQESHRLVMNVAVIANVLGTAAAAAAGGEGADSAGAGAGAGVFHSALQTWMATPGSLAQASPHSLFELWGALREQLVLQQQQQQQPMQQPGSSSSSGETAAADGSQSAQPALPTLGSANAAGVEAVCAPAALRALKLATGVTLPRMTQRELGRVLSQLGALQVNDADLLAAATAALTSLERSGEPVSAATRAAAAWLAAQAGAYSAALLQPALVAAAADPASFDAAAAVRVLRLTSMLPAHVVEEQRRLLLAELHRRASRRGPAPEPAASAAAGGAAAAEAEWVTALCDDAAGRLDLMAPRDVALLLSAYASLPGAGLHSSRLPAAVAAHVEVHAHVFVDPRVATAVVTALEQLGLAESVPLSLKALLRQDAA
jgi:hypothetical protein